MQITTKNRAIAYTVLFSAAFSMPLAAQTTAPRTTAAAAEEDVITLSPFEVSSETNQGYTAANTLAGNRLNTELRDIGNAVTVVTSQFLKDIGATSNETLLQYTTNTEVGSIQGNFAGLGDGALLNESDRFARPNTNTRVRGLAAADNSRNYFLTDIPWDGYNVDRVDLQRGPNSIMFGQGSPAGLINTGTQGAAFKNTTEAEVRFGSHGSNRGSFNFNRELIDNELAVRVAILRDDEKFKQKPAFDLDERAYGAVRWEPAFLRKGNARTIIKFDFETGEVESNRPRSLPPIDLLTPWFQTGTYQGKDRNGVAKTYNHLNRETFNPHQLQDDNTGRPNHGQGRPSINGGPRTGEANPAFNPRLGNYGQLFGGPVGYFDNASSALQSMWVTEIRETRGISPTGAIDGSLGFNFHRMGGIATEAQYAKAAGLPYAEIYRNYQLTDASVFDFYNNLLDGPNKNEWQNFRTYNFSLAQTFWNDKAGFEITRNAESYDRGQLSLLTDSRQAIYIDINNAYPDGTPQGTTAGANGVINANGTPNPNVGRAFVSDSGQFGNNSYDSDRDSTRATLFVTHDFERAGNGNAISRILGRHTLTGLVAEDNQETDSRNWQRYAMLDQSYRTFLGAPNIKFNDNLLSPNAAIYLGPSLATRTSASGANLPGITQKYTIASTSIRTFDSTWANRPGVDPAALWTNPIFLEADRQVSTQSENPLNYVGWINLPVNITDSETSQANRDLLTTSARLTKSELSTKALVWQGKFLGNSIVGTYGYREDTAKSWGFSRDVNGSPGFGHLDLGSSYKLPVKPGNILDVTSRAYSVVAHVNDLPFLKSATERLPFNVSVFYNSSTNFQPLANRVDAYGQPIAPPDGETKDLGLLFATKDGRYSVKINKYKTTIHNGSSSSIGGQWFIGSSQAWAGNWANRFEFNLKGGNTIDRRVANPDPTDTEYNYGTATGETLAQAQAREAAAVSAWRAWQAKVDPRFYTAWGINLNDLTKDIGASTPQGFAITEDSVSKGYEIEFNAQPTKNWRLSVNASETKAVRTNIGGTALAEFINGYENALKNTAAGDLRIWWGGAGNETTLFQWNQNVGFEWTARKLQEGSQVPELRQWRVNAISNYDFSEGRLKGFNVGAGLRWQDKVVIGYLPTGGSDNFGIDLNSPFFGPSETAIDLWVGYGRRLSDKIDWRVQLNVRNAFDGNDLIPITTQPDGTPAGYRIAPAQLWTITNTFKF